MAYSYRREPSSFEIPSSSALPALSRLQKRLYVVNSGLVRLQNGHQDMYIATTAISLIESDVIDYIKVDTGI